jgi:choline dehydrogenase
VFDYIVVGAGSSGCVVAARLSEDPGVNVLLLEAGEQMTSTFISRCRWPSSRRCPIRASTGLTGPSPSRTSTAGACPCRAGKVIGGSGSINGMFAMRGHPKDYDQWAQMGATGWSFADVLPYFKKSEDSWRGEGPYHGAGGPVRCGRSIPRTAARRDDGNRRGGGLRDQRRPRRRDMP